jgi:bacterial/archaeal transporter family-2 protein
MTWNLAYALGAAAAGMCIALQASANGKFRQNLGDPWYPAFFSICGTFVTAIIAMLVLRPATPASETLQSTQWWNWIGGPLGAAIVLAGAALTPKLGAAAFIALVVGGQLVCSVFMDHYGLMGLTEQPMTVGRVLGVALVVVGVVCIKYL